MKWFLVKSAEVGKELPRRLQSDIRDILKDESSKSYSLTDENEEEYQDTAYMTKDIAGGINREKDAYPSAQPGDNAMKADIRKKLETRLKEMMKR